MTDTENPKPYVLLESGAGRRLEDLGGVIVDRSSPVAFWKRTGDKEVWKKAQAFHHRSQNGGGHWDQKKSVPASWTVEHGGLLLKTKLTAFGHLGFFPEQGDEWVYLNKLALKTAPQTKALNLFAYTGGSTMALAKSGVHVTHVDAAKGVVDWARENATLNNIPNENVRFIVDDCIKFLQREQRRGNKYKIVVLDPPSYGRGPKGEVFKLEDQLDELLTCVAAVLDPEPILVHFSCHSQGFSPSVLTNISKDYFGMFSQRISHEMLVTDKNKVRPLASGAVVKVYNEV